MVSNRFTNLCATRLLAMYLCATHFCATQVCATYVCATHTWSTQVCAPQICAPQICAPQVCATNLRSASLRNKSLRHIKVSNNKQQPKLSVCAVDTPNSTAVQSSTFYNWFIRCKGIKVYVILTIPSEFWRYIISLLSYLCIDVECMMDSPVMTTSKKCGYRRKPFLLLLFLSLTSLLFSATQWLKINQNWLSSTRGERSELVHWYYFFKNQKREIDYILVQTKK